MIIIILGPRAGRRERPRETSLASAVPSPLEASAKYRMDD